MKWLQKLINQINVIQTCHIELLCILFIGSLLALNLTTVSLVLRNFGEPVWQLDGMVFFWLQSEGEFLDFKYALFRIIIINQKMTQRKKN